MVKPREVVLEQYGLLLVLILALMEHLTATHYNRFAMATQREPFACSRFHMNGVTAVVSRLPHSHDRVAYGVTLPTNTQTLLFTAGFEAAKMAADVMSKCRQPCHCPPWSE